MTPRRRGPVVEIGGRIALAVGAVIFSLVALELGNRAWRAPRLLIDWPNLVVERLQRENGASCSHVYDSALGWTTGTNVSRPDYHTGPDGIRVTPAAPASGEGPVLATGSSFVEGDEVADDETWPAYLQAMTGRKVINAGVGAYSLDQSVLRTEQMAAVLKPSLIVMSFTVQDIPRSELKISWTRRKPYFTLKEGVLELNDQPVPRDDNGCNLPFWSRWLGWSLLAGEMVNRLGMENGWYYDDVAALPPGAGEALVCPMMRRLSRIGIPILVVAQTSRFVWNGGEDVADNRRLSRLVLDCAREAGLLALDPFDFVQGQVQVQGIDALYRVAHHTPEGNRLVAEAIARELEQRHLTPKRKEQQQR